jgi:hypothetical protein
MTGSKLLVSIKEKPSIKAVFSRVEMVEIESTSELGIHDASTVRSLSLAEPLQLANFFVVTDFISVIVAKVRFLHKILNSSNFI